MMRIRHTREGEERTVDLEAGPMTIGRADPLRGEWPDIDLGATSLSVSREHARLTEDEADQWWLEDLGSTNGTRVDGRRLAPHQAVKLTPGMTVAIGDTVLRVVDEP